jgi:hypothetical protein
VHVIWCVVQHEHDVHCTLNQLKRSSRGLQFETQIGELQTELASWQSKHNTAMSACAAAQEALSDMQKQNKALQTELDLKALLLGNANSGKQELQVRCCHRCHLMQCTSQGSVSNSLCHSDCPSIVADRSQLTMHVCCRWPRRRQSSRCLSCSCRCAAHKPLWRWRRSSWQAPRLSWSRSAQRSSTTSKSWSG